MVLNYTFGTVSFQYTVLYNKQLTLTSLKIIILKSKVDVTLLQIWQEGCFLHKPNTSFAFIL